MIASGDFKLESLSLHVEHRILDQSYDVLRSLEEQSKIYSRWISPSKTLKMRLRSLEESLRMSQRRVEKRLRQGKK